LRVLNLVKMKLKRKKEEEYLLFPIKHNSTYKTHHDPSFITSSSAVTPY
jgi:hypothetical protein